MGDAILQPLRSPSTYTRTALPAGQGVRVVVSAGQQDGRYRPPQLGPLEANPPGAGLGTFPLVKRALQGYVRDDVWVYDRRVYRVAARPVMAGSEYAGAIVHGYRLEKALPEKLSTYLGGATIAFFNGS